MKILANLGTTLRGPIAALAIAAMLPAMLLTTGCTPSQKATASSVVSKINADLPAAQDAADTVAAFAATLAPADALLINVGDVAFDAAVQTLQALCVSYLKAPTAGILTQIETAITTLSANVNSATLQVLHITDPQSQQLAIAALKGLATVIAVITALIANLMPVAQLIELRREEPVKLARLRPYLDDERLHAMAAHDGIDIDAGIRQAEEFGF